MSRGTDVEDRDSHVYKPPGKLQQKPAILPGVPLTKICILFASQTGTAKVPLEAVRASKCFCLPTSNFLLNFVHRLQMCLYYILVIYCKVKGAKPSGTR